MRVQPTLTTAVALVALGLGSGLALNHPLWPGPAWLAFLAWGLVAACRPLWWLVVVPAALPLLNFGPWSGWLMFEEFDILLLGLLAGGYARLAVMGDGGRAGMEVAHASDHPSFAPGLARDRLWGVLLLGLALSGVLALGRGLADASAWSFGWFDGYTAPLNSLRVFKSLGYALLLVPIVRQAMRCDAERSIRSLGVGVLLGLAVVSLAVLWERHAFPGLFDFSRRYRTTALFWEMHVGGAALDAYLAIALPFLLWGLAAARRPMLWVLMALLTVAATYAVLTTFSRGVYLAVALPCAGLALARWRRQRRPTRERLLSSGSSAQRVPGWKHMGSMLLAIVLLMEVMAVLLGGSYMGERLGVADRDMARRLTHWRNGLGLLSTPTDWMLGIGMGRLPAHYARQVAGGEFPGTVTWQQEVGAEPADQLTRGTGFARLQGPARDASLAGWFGLARRVELSQGAQYRLGLDLRADADTRIAVRVCERHLLFDGACQYGQLDVAARPAVWQSQQLSLHGAQLSPGAWFAPRLGMLSLSVLRAGASVDLANIRLSSSTTGEFVKVGDFSRGLAHWLPVAQVYFLPWHIDNVFLELLIERGVLGLLLVLLGLACALRGAIGRDHEPSLLPGVMSAGLVGAALVGVFVSILDVPRVAFLLFLLGVCLIEWRRGTKSR